MARVNFHLTRGLENLIKETIRMLILVMTILSLVSASVVAPIKLEPIARDSTLNESNSVENTATIEPIRLLPETTTKTTEKLDIINLSNIEIENILDIIVTHPKLVLENTTSELEVKIIPRELDDEIKTKINFNSAKYNLIIEQLIERENLEFNKTLVDNKINDVASEHRIIKNITENVTSIVIKVTPDIKEINNATYELHIPIFRINKTELENKAINEWKFSNITLYENEIDAKLNRTKIKIAKLKDINDLSSVVVIADNKTKQSVKDKLKTIIEPKSKILTANLGNTSATLSLEKLDSNYSAENIYSCDDWSYLKEECNNEWEITNISFIDNSTHIVFNVTHFSAYMAGASTSLWIWDETDTNGWFNTGNTRYSDENIIFYANYTRSNGNKIPTGQANCYIKFNESGTWGTYELMPIYDGATGIREFTRNFTSSGTYNYNITCNGTFTEIELQDDVIVNFAGTKLRQYKDVIYDRNNDVFNITITLENLAPFEEIVYVYDILDLNMNASGFSIMPINNGTYLGTTISGKYYEWNLTMPSGTITQINYTATPISGNAKTKDVHGLG